ncbi:MAG: hypothetical protein LBG65_01525 [Puniceicoccales bacterium]|jgi:hypothetical protein|nr:hypothetical protein [Puniceicoccales bacterium]
MKTAFFHASLLAATVAVAPLHANAHDDNHGDADHGPNPSPVSISEAEGLAFAPEVVEGIGLQTEAAAPRAIVPRRVISAKTLGGAQAVAFSDIPSADAPFSHAVGQRFRVIATKQDAGNAQARKVPATTIPASSSAAQKDGAFATLTHISSASQRATGQLELLFKLEGLDPRTKTQFLSLVPDPTPPPVQVAVAIPRAALLETATGTFVYLVTSDGSTKNDARAANENEHPHAHEAKGAGSAHSHGKDSDKHAHTDTPHAHHDDEENAHALKEPNAKSAQSTPQPARHAPRYRRIPVRTGIADATHIAITHGLSQGDTIVTSPITQLWLTELRLTKGGGHGH